MSLPSDTLESPVQSPSGPRNSTPLQIHNGGPPAPPAFPPPPHLTNSDADADHDDDDDGDDDSEDIDGNGDGDDEDDEDEDEDDEELDHAAFLRLPASSWHPIREDCSVPCDDEMAYIRSKAEYSALDHQYWEQELFFSIDDSDFEVVDSGRIDWLLEHFNGTKDAPNMEYILRSDTITVGGFEWRIKFFPRGDNTEFLSLYVECVSMQSDNFTEFEDFESLPFPLLNGADHSPVRRRRSVAAQVGVVMYNPSEPRVNHYQSDASQFTKRTSDFGWRYFSRENRNSFYFRRHGERQAILRDDKLAFSAYIRVVSDPTGCAWVRRSEHDRHDLSVMTTGLFPFTHQWPQLAAFVPLCHFAPFRKLILECRCTSRLVRLMRSMLLKMFTRSRPTQCKQAADAEIDDAVMILRRMSRELCTELDSNTLINLIGSFDPNKGACIGRNRLATKDCCSVAEALGRRPNSRLLETPALLTIELERREFDRTSRTWKMLDNYVCLDDEIVVGDHKYSLFAFGTHLGPLTSNRHRCYVRPGGLAGNWYAYKEGKVQAMTSSRALASRCGIKALANGVDSKTPAHNTRTSRDAHELAYVVYYVRGDHAQSAFALPRSESWDLATLHDQSNSKEVPWSSEDAVMEGDICLTHDEAFSSNGHPCDADAFDEAISQEDGEEDLIMSDVASDGTVVGHVTSSGETITEPLELINVVIDALGRDYYEGNMIGCKRHGQGHWIRTNGDEYVGSFRDSQPHGEGKMTYSHNGDLYEGSWQCGERHGQGRLTDGATGNVYSGGWKQDRKHGAFVLQGLVHEEEREVCTICFDQAMDTAFFDCGHVIACRKCASRIDDCPICRKPVLSRLQLYGVRMRMV